MNSFPQKNLLSFIVFLLCLKNEIVLGAVTYPLQPNGFVSVAMNIDGSFQVACTGNQWFYWTSSSDNWYVGTPTNLTGMVGVGISTDISPVSIIFSGNDGWRYFDSIVPGNIITSNPTKLGISNTNSLSVSGSLALGKFTQIMGTLDDSVWTSFESSSQYIKVLRVGTVVGSKIKPIGVVGCSNDGINTKYRALDVSSTTIYSSSDGQVFTKKDSNLSWNSDSPVLTSLTLAQDGTSIMIVTSSAGIRYTTNDGSNWYSFGTPIDDSPVQDCAMSSDRTKIVIISGYNVYYSSNYGFLFSLIYPSSSTPTALPETPTRIAINDSGDRITLVTQLSIYQGIFTGLDWAWSSVSIESTPASFVAILK